MLPFPVGVVSRVRTVKAREVTASARTEEKKRKELNETHGG